MGRLARSLSSQIFLYQLLILTATLLIGFGLALNAAQGRLDDEYEQRALAVARSVAATPEIARALEQADRSGIVQARAEAVRRRPARRSSSSPTRAGSATRIRIPAQHRQAGQHRRRTR